MKVPSKSLVHEAVASRGPSAVEHHACQTRKALQLVGRVQPRKLARRTLFAHCAPRTVNAALWLTYHGSSEHNKCVPRTNALQASRRAPTAIPDRKAYAFWLHCRQCTVQTSPAFVNSLSARLGVHEDERDDVGVREAPFSSASSPTAPSRPGPRYIRRGSQPERQRPPFLPPAPVGASREGNWQSWRAPTRPGARAS